MMTVVNSLLYMKVIKKVDPKGSYYKKKTFFLFLLYTYMR